MLINLINPPNPELENPTSYPRLGLLYLAGTLLQEGHDVRYVDLGAANPNDAVIPEADIDAISMVTPEYSAVRTLLNRHRNSGSLKILGGYHPTILPTETMNELQPDVIVSQEGEYVILDVIRDLESGTLKKYYTGNIIEDLDRLPFPRRDLLPEILDYSGIHGSLRPSTTVLSTRGCPFACSFCCRTNPTKGFRERSVDNVYQELKELKEMGVEHIRFVDDAFSWNVQRVHELCERIAPLSMTWLCITRVDSVSPSLLEAMKGAGCVEVSFGIETASPRLVRKMHKGVTVEQMERAIILTKEHDIRSKVFLIANLPGETDEDVEETKRFLLRTQPENWTVSDYILLPGSKLWQSANMDNPVEYFEKSAQLFYYQDKNSSPRAAELRAFLDEHLGQRNAYIKREEDNTA